MGCNSSSTVFGKKDKDGNGVNGSVHTRQNVAVHIGSEVTIHEATPIIVVVFGGPGTKKGTLVGDLAQTFGFKVMSVEKLILRELSKNPDEIGGEGMCDIIGYVKDCQEKVDLHWVLDEMKKDIDKDTSSNYILDIMPNLKGLVRLPSIVKDPTMELNIFESFYPISFALNFSLTPEKAVNEKEEAVCVKPDFGEKKGKLDSGAKSDEADLGRTKQFLIDIGEGVKYEAVSVKFHPLKLMEGKIEPESTSDEADLGLTKIRASLFDVTVRPYVEYFVKKSRLIHVDVSSGVHESIYGRLCEIFDDLNIRSCCTSDTVIIIMFDEKSLNEIELPKYNIQRVSLEVEGQHTIVSNYSYLHLSTSPGPKIITHFEYDFKLKLKFCMGICEQNFVSNMKSYCKKETVLTAVSNVIEAADPGCRAFAVSLAGTPLASEVQTEGKKKIMFVDDEFSKLDFHVKMMARGVPCSKKFKAVSSLNNQVCLFPADADMGLCHKIAKYLTRHSAAA